MKGVRSRLAVIALVASSLCLSERARAQTVALDLRACSAPSEEAVRALLALELRERLVAPGAEEARRADSTVVVRCDQRAAELEVRDSDARRVVDLTSVPEPLRARLLALAIADLATGMLEAARAQGSVATDEVVPEPPPVTRALSARFVLGLSAGVQLAPLLGVIGGLSLWMALRGPLRLYAALELAQARGAVDGGHVRMRLAALRIGPALALERARAGVMLGAGARAAWHHFAGEPGEGSAQARSFSALSLAPTVFVGARLTLAPRWLLLLEAALSHQLRATRLRVEGGSTRSLLPLESAVRVGIGATW